ncbi:MULTISPECIES: hypothetical protein [Lysinibacillus]|uniref:hypothetical protein n=1 Tax=Lysinibacillus TaxID=400634 RepID=UPI00214C9CE5|nr:MULTISPECIES: hypothetical protein [Lysinibacillus]UUV25842.1 hypothetical protein NP781_04295 [Lysinibacillus sp. FN11]UYB48716.1 hypothetical protein OCI51_07090 [Lysinibacillus capsici]
MVRIKIVLQNNKDFETDVETYDAVELHKAIKAWDDTLVPIGNLVINKHHIECIYEIK